MCRRCLRRPSCRRTLFCHLGHVAGIVMLTNGLLVIQDLEDFLSLEEERRLTEALTEIER